MSRTVPVTGYCVTGNRLLTGNAYPEIVLDIHRRSVLQYFGVWKRGRIIPVSDAHPFVRVR